jgi:vacuolar-type H+-ATPase subunit I/STV1
VKFKKNEDGTLVLDGDGNPIAVDEGGEVIDLTKVVAVGKHQRIVDELGQTKTRVDELEGQIGDLQKVAGNAEELKTKVEELSGTLETSKSEFSEQLAAKDKEYALDTALLAAGVPSDRLKAAKALVDPAGLTLHDNRLVGLDLDSFKKDNDYLFAATTAVSSAAASAGAPTDKGDTGLRAAMGLKPKED